MPASMQQMWFWMDGSNSSRKLSILQMYCLPFGSSVFTVHQINLANAIWGNLEGHIAPWKMSNPVPSTLFLVTKIGQRSTLSWVLHWWRKQRNGIEVVSVVQCALFESSVKELWLSLVLGHYYRAIDYGGTSHNYTALQPAVLM